MRLEMDWFDQLQINFEQAPPGFVGIHAMKNQRGCVYFELPESVVTAPDMFEQIYRRALLEWDWVANNHPGNPAACPVCNWSFMSFHFRYKGHLFCRHCGSYYRISGSRAITIQRNA
jgi:hypothetical protein